MCDVANDTQYQHEPQVADPHYWLEKLKQLRERKRENDLGGRGRAVFSGRAGFNEHSIELVRRLESSERARMCMKVHGFPAGLVNRAQVTARDGQVRNTSHTHTLRRD